MKIGDVGYVYAEFGNHISGITASYGDLVIIISIKTYSKIESWIKFYCPRTGKISDGHYFSGFFWNRKKT